MCWWVNTNGNKKEQKIFHTFKNTVSVINKICFGTTFLLLFRPVNFCKTKFISYDCETVRLNIWCGMMSKSEKEEKKFVWIQAINFNFRIAIQLLYELILCARDTLWLKSFGIDEIRMRIYFRVTIYRPDYSGFRPMWKVIQKKNIVFNNFFIKSMFVKRGIV